MISIIHDSAQLPHITSSATIPIEKTMNKEVGTDNLYSPSPNTVIVSDSMKGSESDIFDCSTMHDENHASTDKSGMNGYHSVSETFQALSKCVVDIEQYLKCSICLEAVTDAHCSPECLHRFCSSCITQSLHVCNHECPTCRVHIP